MLKIIRLIPGSAYATDLRSDTLFGILCWGAKWIYGEDEVLSWLTQFREDKPPFLISSAYPYRFSGNGKPVYFLPKPVLKPCFFRDLDKDTLKKQKQFKKVKWIAHSDFNKLINGEISLFDFSKDFDPDSYPNSNVVDQLRSYNRFDRITWNTSGDEGRIFQDRTIYHTGGEEDGLYFFIKCDEMILNKIGNILQYWHHVGIGKNASIGLGKFDFEIQEPNWLKEPDDSTSNISLSLYFPREDEIDSFHQKPNQVWYNIENRKGRVGGIVYKSENPYKKGIKMFTEGSTFPVFAKGFAGRIVEVAERENFKIYHYGYAFLVKSHWKEA